MKFRKTLRSTDCKIENVVARQGSQSDPAENPGTDETCAGSVSHSLPEFVAPAHSDPVPVRRGLPLRIRAGSVRVEPISSDFQEFWILNETGWMDF
jgi:hypothetical protein